MVPQGNPHSLRCQVSGSPPHYFYWSREDGRPLPSGAQQRHQGSELHFPSVQPSDAGVYICTCRNLIHTSNSRAELLVAEAPSKPITVTVEEQRSQSVRPGADVTFICTAKSKVSQQGAVGEVFWAPSAHTCLSLCCRLAVPSLHPGMDPSAQREAAFPSYGLQRHPDHSQRAAK